MIIYIPRGIYEAYKRTYGLRRSSGGLPRLEDLQLPYSPRWDHHFLGSFSQLKKSQVPLYDKFRRTQNYEAVSTVPVIAPRRFEFHGVKYDELPKTAPIVTIRDSRKQAAPAPRTIYLRYDDPTRYRPEYHRRRRDKKVGRGYRRLLSFANRTYGRFDEFIEVADAFGNNVGPVETLTALAVNEAVDYAYGYRARMLRRHIYSKRWYKLPIGIDAIMGGYGAY